MYLISIIIPVYNAENHLEKAINSVINQSIGFKNLELILIDDNSKDGSKKIIEEYCDKFDNIIPYYSNNNHGFPGFGRNMGIKLATSDHIMFLDNDDEYEEDICKKLYETLINENADVVSCGRLIIDNISEIKDNYSKKTDSVLTFENDEILSFKSITIWNKIFKKDIIQENEIKFLENSSADDFAFSVEYNLKSKKMIHLNNYYGYKWNIRTESLSNDIKIEHIEEVIEAYNYIVNTLINDNKLKIAEELVKHMISLLILKSSYLNINLKEYKTIMKKIHNFESSIGFNRILDDKLLNFANMLTLNNLYFLTIIYLRTLKYVRRINVLRKMNRA